MARARPSSGNVINSLFVLTMLMLAYIGAIGFGTVWLRHQISVTANANRALEIEIAEVQRELNDVSARIAYEISPEQLIRHNARLNLNLVMPREEQIVRTTQDVERRLADKRFGRLFSAAIEPAPEAPPSK